MQNWVRALNKLYAETSSFYATDSNPAGFYWLEVNQSELSVYAWVRQGEGGKDPVVVINKFTPAPRPGCRLGVPNEGVWEVVLSSDASEYGGSDHNTKAAHSSEPIACSHQDQSISLDLPGNSTLFLRLLAD